MCCFSSRVDACRYATAKRVEKTVQEATELYSEPSADNDARSASMHCEPLPLYWILICTGCNRAHAELSASNDARSATMCYEPYSKPFNCVLVSCNATVAERRFRFKVPATDPRLFAMASVSALSAHCLILHCTAHCMILHCTAHCMILLGTAHCLTLHCT